MRRSWRRRCCAGRGKLAQTWFPASGPRPTAYAQFALEAGSELDARRAGCLPRSGESGRLRGLSAVRDRQTGSSARNWQKWQATEFVCHPWPTNRSVSSRSPAETRRARPELVVEAETPSLEGLPKTPCGLPRRSEGQGTLAQPPACRFPETAHAEARLRKACRESLPSEPPKGRPSESACSTSEKGDVVAAAVLGPCIDEIERHDKETKDSGQSTLPIQQCPSPAGKPSGTLQTAKRPWARCPEGQSGRGRSGGRSSAAAARRCAS